MAGLLFSGYGSLPQGHLLSAWEQLTAFESDQLVARRLIHIQGPRKHRVYESSDAQGQPCQSKTRAQAELRFVARNPVTRMKCRSGPPCERPHRRLYI